MIPISTDAPIYHYPIATVTMIVINVLFFLAFCLNVEYEPQRLFDSEGVEVSFEEAEEELARLEAESPEKAREYFRSLTIDWGWNRKQMLSLEFGKIRPWQWLTANFMHADWMHLIGNMIFLWGFGLLVEGKAGAALFTAVYLGMGTIFGAVLQLGTFPFFHDGTALGASAVIFALLALCILWAPANEFTVFAGRFVFDVPILIYGGLFVTKEIAFWALEGFELNTPLLHLLGFAVGIPAGVYLLRSGKIDCEGWDLFSYLGGRTGKESKIAKSVAQKQSSQPKSEPAPSSQSISSTNSKSPATKPGTSSNATALQDQVQEAISVGQFLTALRLQEQLMKNNPNLKWRQVDLYAIIGGVLKLNEFELANRLIELHLSLFIEKQTTLSLTLCKVKLALNRPQEARAILDGMNEAFLNDKEREQYQSASAAVKARGW